jgi:hypothetical protein
MAKIDLNAVAEWARNAGKSAAEFVRECFEVSNVAQTPSPAGPIPIPYPNVSAVGRVGGPQLAGIAPKFPGLPGGNPSTEDNAAIFQDMLQVVRATITGQKADRQLASSERLKDPSGKMGQIQNQIELWNLTQDEALLQLLVSLRVVYALTFRKAFVLVLSQAGQTFRWQLSNTSIPNQMQIADFVVRVLRAAQRAFSMAGGAVRSELEYLAANALALGSEASSYAAQASILGTVITIIIVIIAITVNIFTVGSGGTSMAVVNASVAVIAAAIATVFSTGATAEVVVRALLSLFPSRVGDIAEAVCRGWLLAGVRPALGAIVRALLQVLGFTAEQIAVLLRKTTSLDFATIAGALVAEFGRDANLLARAFRAAGAGARDIATALRNAGFSAVDTGRAIKDELGLNSDQVAAELRNAGFSAEDVTQAIANLFRNAADAARSIISNFGR